MEKRKKMFYSGIEDGFVRFYMKWVEVNVFEKKSMKIFLGTKTKNFQQGLCKKLTVKRLVVVWMNWDILAKKIYCTSPLTTFKLEKLG